MRSLGGLSGYCVFIAVICLGITHVKAQQEARCLDIIDKADSIPGSDMCEADYQYMKCIVKDYSYQYLGVNTDLLVNFRNRIHSALIKQNIDCYVDILKVAREVRLEDLAERFNATDIPVKEFDSAMTVEDCTEAFVFAATSSGAVTCDHGINVAKCVARVTRMDVNELPQSHYINFQEDVELTLQELGVNCTIDINSIMSELHEGGVQMSTTTSMPIPTTPKSSSQDPDAYFVNANVSIDCLDELMSIQSHDPSILTCDIARSYTKCVFRFSDLPVTPLTPLKARSIENEMLRQTNALDLGCSLDIQGIINEILAEQNLEAVTEVIMMSTTTTTAMPKATSSESTTKSTTTTTTPAPAPATDMALELEPSFQTAKVVPSYDHATNVMDCANVFASLLESEGWTCEGMYLQVRCVIRVLDLHKADLQPAIIQAFQSQLEEEFSILGLDCVMDVQRILDDLRGVQEKKCLINKPDACVDVENGNYPVCGHECQDGKYITCSNNYIYFSSCPLAWYKTPRGNRITANMVFDPSTGHCKTSTPTCPRPLDQFIE